MNTNIARHLMLSTATFAAAGAAKGATAPTTNTTAAAPSRTAAASKAPRVAPELTAVTDAVPMPEFSSNRGSKTQYPFASLVKVGQSFGVKNKTALQLGAIVNTQNKKEGVQKRNPDGSLMFEMQNVTGPDGSVTSTYPDVTKPVREAVPQFRAHDVANPKADPDGAKARVFRVS